MNYKDRAIKYFQDYKKMFSDVLPEDDDILGYYDLAISGILSLDGCKSCEQRAVDKIVDTPQFTEALNNVDRAYKLILDDIEHNSGKNVWKFFPSNWRNPGDHIDTSA